MLTSWRMNPCSPSTLGAGYGDRAVSRVDGVLFGALGLLGGALFVASPWAVLTCGASVALVAFLRGRRGLAVLLVVAASVGALRARAAFEGHEQHRSSVVGRFRGPATCDGRGRVVSSPSRRGDVLQLDLEPMDLVCEGVGRVDDRVLVYLVESDRPTVARGDELELTVQLAPRERFLAPEIDGRAREAARGVSLSGSVRFGSVVRAGRGPGAWIDRARAHVRGRIDATFPPDVAPLARALVLGESDVAEADAVAFKESGLMHLLAVSGMHLVLVVATLVRGLEAALVRVPWVARGGVHVARYAAVIGAPLAWVYADFAGGSGSARRAAIMTAAVLAARALDRRLGADRALGWSIVATWLAEPLCVYDASFALSVCATAGLLAGSGPIESWLGSALRAPTLLARPLAATVAATAACAPVTLGMSRSLPLGGILANLVAVPVGEVVALPLCLLHALAAPVAPVERGLAVVAGGALRALAFVARTAAELEWLKAGAPPPTGGQIAVLAGGVALGWLGVAPRRGVLAAAAVLLAVLELGARRAGAPIGELRVTFLDVGQGDAALLDLPDGQAILIDGGGIVGSPIDTGARVVAPVLRARRRSRLAVAALSHPHPDHFGGLAAGIAGVDVEQAWDTGEGASRGLGGGYAAWLWTARARGARVRFAGELCGDHVIGGVTIEVLAPCPGPRQDDGSNDNSMVLRVRYGARRVLFVGDLERPGEDALIARARARLGADVLKVGHHGSRTSTSAAMLAAVEPRVAVVSTGARNRFGHPHPAALGNLDAAGVRTFRTDQCGAVVLRTDGTKLEVTTSDPTCGAARAPP